LKLFTAASPRVTGCFNADPFVPDRQSMQFSLSA
jgi:hypothetical protein